MRVFYFPRARESKTWGGAYLVMEETASDQQERDERGERGRSEVTAAALAAGLSVDEGAPGAQVLKFAENLNSDELKLMELPHEVLGALKEGERCVYTQHTLRCS